MIIFASCKLVERVAFSCAQQQLVNKTAVERSIFLIAIFIRIILKIIY
jgi:hypothetical protein